jgi:hypothetical protein
MKQRNHFFDNRQYAFYRGEKFICAGTLTEIAQKVGVKRLTLQWYKYPSHLRRNKNNPNTPFVVCIEEEEK